MTKEERMKLRKMLLYIADCMIAVNDMEEMHDCNDCGLRLRCAYLPQVGTPVRYNCPLWRGLESGGGNGMKDEQRYITLLRAAHELLRKQYHAGIVLNLLEETVFYDDAECDGNCLLNDIEYYFDEIGVEMPEKERVNP